MIILQFNHAYHRWGLLMARSLALHEPQVRVFVDAIDLTAEEVAQLEEAHPASTIENVSVAPGAASREFMAGRKPLVLLAALERFPGEQWYGLFDADLLVRRPLGDLWAKLVEHPASLIRTNGIWQGRAYEHLLVPSGNCAGAAGRACLGGKLGGAGTCIRSPCFNEGRASGFGTNARCFKRCARRRWLTATYPWIGLPTPAFQCRRRSGPLITATRKSSSGDSPPSMSASAPAEPS